MSFSGIFESSKAFGYGTKETVEELVAVIKNLTPGEKLVVLGALQHPADPCEQEKIEKRFRASYGGWKGDETAEELIAEIYNSCTLPTDTGGEKGKKLPERYEPSHKDLDEIFGGFQSSKAIGELVEEVYRLRTMGTERELLDQ